MYVLSTCEALDSAQKEEEEEEEGEGEEDSDYVLNVIDTFI